MSSNDMKWILAILWIIVILIIVFHQRVPKKWRPTSVEEAAKICESTDGVPKVIWTFWDNEPSDLIKMCINSWAQWNPDYRIVVLNKSTVPEYHGVDSVQRLSDYVRVDFLSRYGGVWSDASIKMNAPLPQYEGFHGYYQESVTTNPKFPVIESWFFACPKNHPFVNKWKDKFFEVQTVGADKFVNSVKNDGVDTQKIENHQYLAIYIAAQHVLQKYGPFHMNLKKAEDGPFRHSINNGWNAKKSVDSLMHDQPEMIKFIGAERAVGIPDEIFGYYS